jgi:hypothetical protein
VAGGERREQREQERAAQEMGGQALSVVVEFQKVELDRLLKDNRRLNERLDRLGEEIRHFREMQQREQILRQQEQNLREQAQAMLDRLTQRLALPEPETVAGNAALGNPEADTAPAPTPLEPAGTAHTAPPVDSGPRDGEATRAGPAGNDAAAATVAAASALGGGETEFRGKGPPPEQAGSRAWETARPPLSRSAQDRPAPQGATTPTATPVIPPAEEPLPGPAPEPSKPGADDTGELAEILADLGRSLRDLDNAPPTPVKPPAVAEDPGDSAVRAGVRAVSPPPREHIPPKPGAPLPLPEIPDEEQAALVDMLGRMGPSAGDRRSAARIMRRLFRNRNTPRGRNR